MKGLGGLDPSFTHAESLHVAWGEPSLRHVGVGSAAYELMHLRGGGVWGRRWGLWRGGAPLSVPTRPLERSYEARGSNPPSGVRLMPWG